MLVTLKASEEQDATVRIVSTSCELALTSLRVVTNRSVEVNSDSICMRLFTSVSPIYHKPMVRVELAPTLRHLH
jgi:hypothetical protein